MKPAPENIAAPASKSNDGQKIFRDCDLHPGLAADVVGPAPRSFGPLAAGYRNRRHRPWPGARCALERPDKRRAYFLGGGAHAERKRRDERAEPACRCTLPERRTAE